MGLFADKYPEVPYAEKLRLWEEVKADERFPDYMYGCYECGICVAACPSARFYDFSPRKIAQAAAREDVELIFEQMNDDVWNCSQCFSCNRCPRQNSPGGLITILREVAVNNGLKTAKQALEGYSRIVYKIMGTGTQVSPDMLQPDAFPDWGPDVRRVSQELDLWRRALPPETLHTTSTGWQV
ncbi:MAG TPA: 4Fe-4S dicluster domain-containing protein, partial [Anaerolineales bacterium]|nr:4Fe-4S dicluster domain-containing protein [Anaerolineales bacterium]